MTGNKAVTASVTLLSPAAWHPATPAGRAATSAGLGSHPDALVPRVVHRAQGGGSRVERAADLHGPLAAVQVVLVDRHAGVDHRQADRTAEGEPIGGGADVSGGHPIAPDHL